MASPGSGMIGRDDALGRLRAAAEDARAGSPQAVLVTGEAGIGRTRLVAEAGRAFAADGWLVATGQAVRQDDGGAPFLPFVQVLGEIVAALDPARRASVLGPVRDDVQRLLPDASSDPVAGRSVEAADDAGPLRQARLFEGVLDVGERVAAIRPLCVVIEDIQWLDRSSADLLRFFVGQARTGRLLLVATARTGPAEPDAEALLVDLVRPSTTWLALDRLSADQTRRLVADRLGAVALAATEIDDLVHRSDGVPMIALELADARARGEPTSPSLEAILAHRLDGLPHPAADAVRAAAILSPTIDELRVAVALDQPVDVVEPAVRIAIEADILAIAARSAGGLMFRHELLRELAERSLLPAQRRRLHRAIAEAAERDATDTPLPAAERARHWAAAGEQGRALRAATEAQAEAAAVAAHDAVLRNGELALLLWPHVAPADRKGIDLVAIERRSADAAMCLEDPATAVGYLRSAVDGSHGPERAQLRGRLRVASFTAGDVLAAKADAQAVLEEPRVPGDDVWRAEAQIHLGGLALADRDWRAAQACSDAAHTRLEGSVDPEAPPLVALARGIGGLARVELGQVDAGLRLVDGAWSDASLGGPLGFDLAYRRYVGVLRRLGHYERLLEVADGGVDVAAAVGLSRTLGQVLAVDRAEALLELGRWREAEAHLAALPWRHGPPGPDDGRVRVEALLALRRDGAIPEGSPAPPDVLAEAALLRGAPTDALVHLRTAVTTWLAGPWPADVAPEPIAVMAAWAQADGGQDPDATPLGTLLEPLLTRPIGAFADLLIAERQRAAKVDAGDASARYPHVLEAWAAAAAALEGAGLRWWLGWARLHGAEASAAAGDRDTARAWADAAWAIAADLGSVPLRRATDRLARRLGLPAPTSVRAAEPGAANQPARHGTRLTPRELDVLRLVVAGYSNREVAERLDISHKTASVHVSNILDKLEVENRTEAAAVAVRLGLVATDPGEP